MCYVMGYVFCYVKSLCSVLRKGFPFLYYAKDLRSLLCKSLRSVYAKVYVLCYVEGYVMINVVQWVHRLTL